MTYREERVMCLKDYARIYWKLDEIWRFFKARIWVLIISNGLAILFVDIIHVKYWIFMLFFTPLSFWINYVFNKKAFIKEGRRND